MLTIRTERDRPILGVILMMTAHESKLRSPYVIPAQIAGTVKEIVHDAITEAGHDSLGLDENKICRRVYRDPRMQIERGGMDG